MGQARGVWARGLCARECASAPRAHPLLLQLRLAGLIQRMPPPSLSSFARRPFPSRPALQRSSRRPAAALHSAPPDSPLRRHTPRAAARRAPSERRSRGPSRPSASGVTRINEERNKELAGPCASGPRVGGAHRGTTCRSRTRRAGTAAPATATATLTHTPTHPTHTQPPAHPTGPRARRSRQTRLPGAPHQHLRTSTPTRDALRRAQARAGCAHQHKDTRRTFHPFPPSPLTPFIPPPFNPSSLPLPHP